MPIAPADRLNAASSLPYLDRRIEEYRKLAQFFTDDAKVWFNLAVDLEASARVLEQAADGLRREARAAALRSTQISPTMRELFPEPIRPSAQPQVVRPAHIDTGPKDPIEARVGATLRGYRVERIAARSEVQVLYDAVSADGQRPVLLRQILDLPGEQALGQFWRDLGNNAAAGGCAKVLDVINDESGTPIQILSRPKGTSVAELYSTAPLSMLDSLDAAVRTARALDRLHQGKLYHGELRPDHVLYAPGNPSEVVLLGGGGVDLLIEGTKQGPLADERRRWLAPETTVGWPVDVRTDVYCLGLLLYFLISGRPAPANEGQGGPRLSASQLQAMRGDEVKVQAKLVERIDRVLSTCLLAVPLQRYPSAGRVADELSDVSQSLRVEIVD